MFKLYFSVLSLVLFSVFSTVLNAEMVFKSSGKRISLLELYTSEGCSSCPPADRWLSKLKHDKRLWREFVPVAFHVDYWNYIGWPDRFSSPVYSERQRHYARTKNISTVYTPGFILNGKEWRSYFGLRKFNPDASIISGEFQVNIDNNQAVASYRPTTKVSRTLVLNIAVLGFDLMTDIKAGENRGKELTHDFVVLGFDAIPLSFVGADYTVTTMLPEVSVETSHKGIAAWISYMDDPTPIQTVGGWLDKIN